MEGNKNRKIVFPYNSGHVLDQFCDMIVRYHELRFGEDVEEYKATTITFYRYLALAAECGVAMKDAIKGAADFAYNFIDGEQVLALEEAVTKNDNLASAIPILRSLGNEQIKRIFGGSASALAKIEAPLFVQSMIESGEKGNILDTALYQVANTLEQVYLLQR